jgi:hypothetical protein
MYMLISAKYAADIANILRMAFAELQPRATRLIAADFLRRVLEKLPYKVHTVLTDTGV